MLRELLTIGYQGREPAELAGVLEEHGVDVLVDVRDKPISRKPGFSKRALGELVGARGIRVPARTRARKPEEQPRRRWRRRRRARKLRGVDDGSLDARARRAPADARGQARLSPLPRTRSAGVPPDDRRSRDHRATRRPAIDRAAVIRSRRRCSPGPGRTRSSRRRRSSRPRTARDPRSHPSRRRRRTLP